MNKQIRKTQRLRLIVELALLSILASCSHINQSDLFYEDTQKATHIEIEKILDNKELKKENFKLSEIADSIIYIKLGSKNAKGEEGFLKRTRKLFLTDDYIVVNDFTTVLLFDKVGNFLRQLGQRGGGPSEYLWAEGSTVDISNKKVYIGSETKVVIYDFDNQFISSFPIEEEFDRMEFLENGKLLINRPNLYGMLKNKLSLVDSAGNILKSYPNYFNFTPHTNEIVLVGGSNVHENFYKTPKRVLYKEAYNDTIFSLNNYYELVPAIYLNLGKYTVPLHLRAEYLVDEEAIKRECNNCYRTFTTETDKYFMVECRPVNMENPTMKLVVCNKTNKDCFYTEQPIINDLDNGPDILPSGITPDGKYIYAWMSCSRFTELVDKKNNISALLAAFAKTVDEDDNLIIIKIKLK